MTYECSRKVGQGIIIISILECGYPNGYLGREQCGPAQKAHKGNIQSRLVLVLVSSMFTVLSTAVQRNNGAGQGNISV